MKLTDRTETTLNFSAWFAARRAKMGVGYPKLAKLTGLSVTSLWRIEHRTESPSLDTFHKICEGLGVTPESVFRSFRKTTAKKDAEPETTQNED